MNVRVCTYPEMCMCLCQKRIWCVCYLLFLWDTQKYRVCLVAAANCSGVAEFMEDAGSCPSDDGSWELKQIIEAFGNFTKLTGWTNRNMGSEMGTPGCCWYRRLPVRWVLWVPHSGLRWDQDEKPSKNATIWRYRCGSSQNICNIGWVIRTKRIVFILEHELGVPKFWRFFAIFSPAHLTGHSTSRVARSWMQFSNQLTKWFWQPLEQLIMMLGGWYHGLRWFLMVIHPRINPGWVRLLSSLVGFMIIPN